MVPFSGEAANRSRRFGAFRRGGFQALVLACAGIFLASCGKSDEQVLTDACVQAGSSSPTLAHDQLAVTCACVSRSARAHLASDDYSLLVKFVRINGESAPAEVKADKLITSLAGWGVSGPKAAAAAVDIMAFGASATQECSSRGTGDS